PVRQARLLHESRRPDRGRCSLGDEAGRLLLAGDQARLLPAHGRRPPVLPRQRRARPRPLAIRPLLCRRHAEVGPRAGQDHGSGRPGRHADVSEAETQAEAAALAFGRVSGQYVAYTCYRIDPAWRRLPIEERAAGKDAFAEVVEDWV